MNVVAFPIPKAQPAPAQPDTTVSIQEATDLAAQAERLTLTSRVEYDHAADLVKHVKSLARKVEEERQRIVRPLNEQVA